jgi:uncharacterized protein
MQIAIIGGGASGIIAAYLLDQQGHQVTVYERQPVLGGHIRTLNQNISSRSNCPELLEMGVLEFPIVFTNFLQLMQELEIPLEPVAVGSGIFFREGRHFLSPGMIEHNFRGWKKWREIVQIKGLYARSIPLWLQTHLASLDQLHGQPLSAYLAAESPQATWIKLLTMYSYSMPYQTIADFPAELAIPALRRYVFSNWVRIKGGVYSYIAKILSRFTGELFLNAEVMAIHRADQVQIQGRIADGSRFDRSFDQVIFATPPDQVLQLLADARPEELRRFQAWQPNYATTVLHHDRQLYAAYGIQQGSEFDFFQTQGGWGYNAALNQLCGISSKQLYSLAFNLEDAIAPETVIHLQQHHTPRYTVEAFRYLDEVRATNGENNTFYVGAYLGDGLHEGAVTSAMKVAQAIGAATIENDRPASRHPANLLRS